ncbi:hypothetical protein GLOIN_2v1812804 [Rhizophagus irregularis DAOM 181602=DAOM 197198]|nr:hypothetical protein GLOIN_2v1812804 [Rhizophagus irregularis DAOM 181602=DAOM 197198]
MGKLDYFISLPLLKGRLPQSYFLGWSNFVEAVQLCIQPRIDFEDLDKIRNLLIQFYNHYARRRKIAVYNFYQRMMKKFFPISKKRKKHGHRIGDIRDIEESYMKYGKLRTKDGNIVSSKWWKKENDSSRNDYCVAINLTIDEQEEETFGQVEYFMLHNMQNQERMFAYIRKIKKLEKNIGNLKFFDCFGPLQCGNKYANW